MQSITDKNNAVSALQAQRQMDFQYYGYFRSF
nr:MAG TPA: hypothetical protein [Microviridae sp.]